jgi:hypothetical protein
LPIRGVLYTLSDGRSWLIAVQLLDGGGAGIFGALMPLVLAHLMPGTGRSNAEVALIAFVVFLLAMPEAAEPATTEHRQPLLSDRGALGLAGSLPRQVLCWTAGGDGAPGARRNRNYRQ